MSLEKELSKKLTDKGADFVHYVDISNLSYEQNKGYPNAVLIGILLSPDYLLKVISTPNYVEEIKSKNLIKEDEFHKIELKTDSLADYIANYLLSKGYSAYSQSEKNIYSTGFYDEASKSTPLPHKTIALLAGLGWIGKHNLLVTPEYGSAFSMCTVLTDAPLETVLNTLSPSYCGDCNVCENICQVKAIKDKSWEFGMSRDEIVDVFLCNPCLQCLALCPWTHKYMKKGNMFKTHI